MNRNTFDILLWIWMAIAVIVFFILRFVTAPYGRHSDNNWGITIPNRAGWFMMELPALLVFTFFILSGTTGKNATVWIISSLFIAHYVNRSLIFPWRIRTSGKRMPLLIALLAVVFNSINGAFLGYFCGTLQTSYNAAWLSDPRFAAGILLFITGMIINISSDEKLIRLRKNRGNSYRIPSGGLARLVSCPNFFGEIIEWLGYAILCWSLPALSFFIWTFCNLVPRAKDHHKWYQNQFPDYPHNRKAVIPFII